jgi:hypothetical protein
LGDIERRGARCRHGESIRSMVRVLVQNRHKLNSKAEPGRLLGFDQPNLKAYRVMSFEGVFVRSRDIVAQEDFEFKADRSMQDFEIEAGNTQPKSSSPTPVTTTSPVSIPAAVPVPTMNFLPPDCTAPVSIPSQEFPAQDNTLRDNTLYPEDDDNSQQAAHGHCSARINRENLRLGSSLLLKDRATMRL